jgi:hypothetical protein
MASVTVTSAGQQVAVAGAGIGVHAGRQVNGDDADTPLFTFRLYGVKDFAEQTFDRT